jgi:hypothetical protein
MPPVEQKGVRGPREARDGSRTDPDAVTGRNAMPISAALVDQIIASAVTEDGRYAALTVADAEANCFTLGIPCDRLPELVEASARALADSAQVNRRGWDQRARIAATWWILNRDEASDSLVLSLTLGMGGQLCFALSQPMAAALRDSLSAHLDLAREGERGFGSRCAAADRHRREMATLAEQAEAGE